MVSPITTFDRAKESLSTIGVIKQNVFRHSYEVFESVKKNAEYAATCLSSDKPKIDDRIKVSFKDISKNECWLQFGGDLLIFSLHTNVFAFDKGHSLYNTQYVLDNPNRAYFSMVEIFNFLNDSVVYDRYRDIGELMARIFINAENHFFVEGMGPLGSLYTDLENQILDDCYTTRIIESCIVASIQYDLWAPPFQDVRYIPLASIIEQNGNSPRTTSKRMGYDITSTISENPIT
jgi:hypothetical protein